VFRKSRLARDAWHICEESGCGLVLRAALKTDRRVKMLVVTDEGMKVRKRMLQRLSEAPEPIARLSDDDQRALCEILKRAVETPH